MSDYMNYEFYTDYSSYVAALRRIGFTIETVSATSCKAYWKNFPNENVYLFVEESGSSYSGYKYVHVSFHVGDIVMSNEAYNKRRAYTTEGEELDSGNTIYISDVYWDGIDDFPSRDDTFRVTIYVNHQGTGWRHKALYFNIGDTSIPVISNVAQIPKTFIKNFTSDTSYSVIYEDTDEEIYTVVLNGFIRKSDYKFTTTVQAAIDPYDPSTTYDVVGTVERVYCDACLPYVELEHGGIVFPNFGTYFLYDPTTDTTTMMKPSQVRGLSDYYIAAFIPPTDDSTNWLFVRGTRIFTCNSNSINEITLTTDSTAPAYPKNIINDSATEQMIFPIIDPYDEDNCGAITNLNYTARGFQYLTFLGLFAEYDRDLFYIVKRTTALDSSRNTDPYYYVMKVATAIGEGDE